jgi:predicted N-acetyltransferase YhbS
MAKIQIKQENPQDYEAVEAVLCSAHAFDPDMIVSSVRRFRQEPDFDPRLSLCAFADDIIQGHIIFVKQKIRWKQDFVEALELMVVSVTPDYQKQGIGSALIRHGHQIARDLGYTLSVVEGWEGYFPRFGYKPLFGVPKTVIATSQIPDVREELLSRDQLWIRNNADVNMAMAPRNELAYWKEPFAKVFCDKGGRIVGYLLFTTKPSPAVFTFESENKTTTFEMLHWLRHNLVKDSGETITLPVHPRNRITEDFKDLEVRFECHVLPYLMACELKQGVLEDYSGRIENAEAVPGIFWPPRNEWHY